jgi:hypothetical protein
MLVGLAILAVVVGPSVPLVAGPEPSGDRPVLAGQHVWGYCSGGFYARLGDTIVLTSTGHCAAEGTVAYNPDGVTSRGVFGPPARDATCPYAGHTCAASDINYLVVPASQIPWGHLNVVNLGNGGEQTIPEGTKPLACGDINVGDRVEFNGRNIHRSGSVIGKDPYLHDQDAAAFPCMVDAGVIVSAGDSGGAVLVRGIPAGVASRSFGSILGLGLLGFTPLAEGLDELGLQLCTTPNCDLVPPGT